MLTDVLLFLVLVVSFSEFTREQVDSLTKIGNIKGNELRNNDDRANPRPTNLEMEGRDNELERYIRRKYAAPRSLPANTNLLSGTVSSLLSSVPGPRTVPLRPASSRSPSPLPQAPPVRSNTTPVFGTTLEHRPSSSNGPTAGGDTDGMRRGRPTPTSKSTAPTSFVPPPPVHQSSLPPRSSSYNPSLQFASSVQAAQAQPPTLVQPQVPTHGPWSDLMTLTQPPLPLPTPSPSYFAGGPVPQHQQSQQQQQQPVAGSFPPPSAPHSTFLQPSSTLSPGLSSSYGGSPSAGLNGFQPSGGMLSPSNAGGMGGKFGQGQQQTFGQPTSFLAPSSHGYPVQQQQQSQQQQFQSSMFAQPTGYVAPQMYQQQPQQQLGMYAPQSSFGSTPQQQQQQGAGSQMGFMQGMMPSGGGGVYGNGQMGGW